MARAEAGELHGLPHAVMRLARGIGDELLAERGSPFMRTFLSPSACSRATSSDRKFAIDVPVTKMPLASSGKPKDSRHPGGDLALDVDRRCGCGRRNWS